MDIHTRKKRKEKKSSIDSRIVIKIGPTTINLAQSKSTRNQECIPTMFNKDPTESLEMIVVND